MAISDTPFDARPRGLSLDERAKVARAPKLRPEQQWWNLPAKYDKAKQIAWEERQRSIALAGDAGAHDNAFDAMRHARWSQRMATEIDPISSRLFGAEHEIEGSLMPSPARLKRWNAPDWLQDAARARDWHEQPAAEALMDMRNNAEGRRAAAEGRPIRPGNLQVRLGEPSPSSDAYPPARPRDSARARR